MHRIRQGMRALFAWARPVDEGLAAQVLTPALMALFKKMRRSERQHSLNVLRMVRLCGYDHPALLMAALLHDVGKVRAPFHLWERVLVVLVKAAAPALAKRWGESDNLKSWKRPFMISVQHPQWGADMVAAAGGDALTVAIIAAHQMRLDHAPNTPMEQLLAALQAADDAN